MQRKGFWVETDAYTFEEEWAIRRGFPGTGARKTDPQTQKEVPDTAKIEASVRKRYAGITTPGAAITGHDPATGETIVKDPDGQETHQPPQAGDSHQDVAKTKQAFDQLPKIPPASWVCPQEKTP